jgi:iron complex outermembrane receptor protein
VGLVPNVTLVDTANVGDTQLSIRGIVSTRDAESTFAYVVDGVLSTNPNSFNEELFDVQQIEVLKGPQGALYGRNAVAGAILVTTKAPSNEFEARVGGTVGNVGTWKANAMVSGPIIEDKLLGRIAVSTQLRPMAFTRTSSPTRTMSSITSRIRACAVAWYGMSPTISAWTFAPATRRSRPARSTSTRPSRSRPSSMPSARRTTTQDPNDVDFRFIFNTPGDQRAGDPGLGPEGGLGPGLRRPRGSVAYNDLEEYLLSDGTAATFYGYELTPACQAGRAELNSFTRPDSFGEPFNPFGVLPPGADFQGVYGPYTPLTCDGYQYQERNQQDFSIDVRLVGPEDEGMRWIAGAYFADIERESLVATVRTRGRAYLRQPYVDPTGPNPTDLLFWDDFETTGLCRLRPARV